ncbi:Rieske (2Fe-2S) protein [Haloplanus litoreus]|uniref:Rieske (2Fe-2S) protein n=1 Tax=Haloplanus litoreus TaxID=767515 RepID=A0ABD6A1F7_9EURY
MTTKDDSPQSESAETRHYVADVDEIADGDRVIVDLDGREIAVFNVGGEFNALSNYCVHQGGPACEGLVSGSLEVDDEMELTYDATNKVVSCPWHGWEFEIESGEHLAPTDYRLPTYRVVVQDGAVYLEGY